MTSHRLGVSRTNKCGSDIRTPPVTQIKDLEQVTGNLEPGGLRTPPVTQIKDLEQVTGNLEPGGFMPTRRPGIFRAEMLMLPPN